MNKRSVLLSEALLFLVISGSTLGYAQGNGHGPSGHNPPGQNPVPAPTQTVTPVTPPAGAPPADNGEAQCSAQIPSVESMLNRCSDNSREIERQSEDARRQLDYINYTWSVAMAPVNACRSNLSDVQNEVNSLLSQIQQQQGNEAAAVAATQNLDQQASEASLNKKGALFECSVHGRHQSFSATSASAAQAIQQALAQCGQNNCGKNDWSPSLNCSIKN